MRAQRRRSGWPRHCGARRGDRGEPNEGVRCHRGEQTRCHTRRCRRRRRSAGHGSGSEGRGRNAGRDRPDHGGHGAVHGGERTGHGLHGRSHGGCGAHRLSGPALGVPHRVCDRPGHRGCGRRGGVRDDPSAAAGWTADVGRGAASADAAKADDRARATMTPAAPPPRRTAARHNLPCRAPPTVSPSLWPEAGGTTSMKVPPSVVYESHQVTNARFGYGPRPAELDRGQ